MPQSKSHTTLKVFLPANRKTTRKLVCLKLDSEFKKKKDLFGKVIMELGISHINFILPTWSKNPQPDILS